MRKPQDTVEILLLGLTLIFFTTLFLIVLLQIVSRFSSTFSFVWTEELARLLFIASVASSAPLAYKYGEFIAIEALLEKIETRKRVLAYNMIHILILAMFTLIFLYGIVFAKLGLNQMSPTLGIPMALPYSSIAFSSLFFMYYLTKNIFHSIYNKRSHF